MGIKTITKKETFFVWTIILSGFLMNTSIYNTSSFGIPLAWGCLPIIILWFLINKVDKLPKHATIFFLYMSIALLVAVQSHIFMGLGNLNSEISQFVSRFFLILFYYLTTIILININMSKVIRISIKLLKVLIIYGLYQYLASLYKLPLFLDFLRNNASYNFASSESTGGWLDTYRIYSVWAEPSFSSIPIAFFMYLLLFHSDKIKEKIIWISISGIYTYFTFSRLTWLVYSITLCFYLLLMLVEKIGSPIFLRILEKSKYVITLSYIFVSYAWVYIAPIIMDDISTYGRSSSVIIGTRMFLDNMIVGSGMNSYKELESMYNFGLEYYFPQSLPNNLFISYAQQMGVFGILVSFFPLFFLLNLKKIELKNRLVIVFSFITIGNFGFDLFYMPLSWFILAFFSANGLIDREHKLNST